MSFKVFVIPLVLLVSSEVSSTEAILLPNFYPFGESEGDLLLPPNDDGSSGTVPISIPFPYFDNNQDSLFVSIKQPSHDTLKLANSCWQG